MAKRHSFLQKLTGIHQIHHIKWSWGWKLPFVQLAKFKDGWKWVHPRDYHNCTATGRY